MIVQDRHLENGVDECPSRTTQAQAWTVVTKKWNSVKVLNDSPSPTRGLRKGSAFPTGSRCAWYAGGGAMCRHLTVNTIWRAPPKALTRLRTDLDAITRASVARPLH